MRDEGFAPPPRIKVGDVLTPKPDSFYVTGSRTVTAVSPHGDFVNVSDRAAINGWWPVEVFETPKPPKPTQAVVTVKDTSGVKVFRLAPGDTLTLDLRVIVG